MWNLRGPIPFRLESLCLSKFREEIPFMLCKYRAPRLFARRHSPCWTQRKPLLKDGAESKISSLSLPAAAHSIIISCFVRIVTVNNQYWSFLKIETGLVLAL